MKRFMLALLLTLTAAPLVAQVKDEAVYRPADVVKGRFSTTTVPNPYPMIFLDEETMDLDAWTLPFPEGAWNEAKLCLARMGVPMSKAGKPPIVVVIPYAATFRVRDLAVDSMIAAEDSTAELGRFGPPTVGWAMLHSNAVLVTERFRTNRITLRHEAIHFLLFRTVRIFGHEAASEKYFQTCDVNFERG